MVEQNSKIAFYGVHQRSQPKDEVSLILEQLKRNGFAVLDSGFDAEGIVAIRESFDHIHTQYVGDYGEQYLRKLDEFNTVRMPLLYDLNPMLTVLSNPRLRAVLDRAIEGIYILNQQNLIVNPSGLEYNQSAWHRDLPYQHFVSSTPLAVNALYCVDDFNESNGASFVIPNSHSHSEFPSDRYIEDHQVQILAPAGFYIILDCMTYHRGGFNDSEGVRRAINQVFTIPYFKQQICVPNELDTASLPSDVGELLGLGQVEPQTVAEFLARRETKAQTSDA